MQFSKQITRLAIVCSLMIALTVINIDFLRAVNQLENPLQWPEIKSEHKPGTYWWWMGNAVNKKDLKTLLEKYDEAGLGGTKIIPIYGAKGHEDEYIDFLTPEWMDMLAYTSKVSDRLNMTVDLGATTGWNMGGPWVRFEDASKRVVLDTYTLLGGQRLRQPVKHVQEPYTNLRNQPREPISANPLLHRKNNFNVRYERDLPLISLMAYSEKGKVLDLKDQVGRDGTLNWIAPAGEWSLYAVFLGTVGKTVERAAPGGVGWMIDYLSNDAVIRQMRQFERAFSKAGYEMDDLVRAIHDDSFELYTDWTEGFFKAFKKLHGYDLRAHFPTLFGKGTEERVSRVKSDYRETLSHLIIEEHTVPWTEWANERGIKTINQATYGSPAHPLDNWAASDQPENTGGGPVSSRGSNHPLAYSKLASSAAHVTGKKIISQETATTIYGHFHNSLADVKNIEVDKIFLNGSNKIYYHSTSYSPEEARWPGWLYYAPTHFVPANTIWRDFPKLNSYVTRVSSFLQAGNPDNDILLYYPVYDMWYEEEGLPMDFPRIPDDLKTTKTALRAHGYAFDYISDQQIMNTTCREDGRLITGGGNDYQSVVLPSVRFIPVETLEYLIDLAEEGATIVFSGGFPRDVPGFGQLSERRDQFHKLIEDLKDFRRRNDTQGKILLNQEETGNVVPKKANVPREPMAEEGLRFVRRSYEGGHNYFIKNIGDQEINEFVSLAREAKSAAIFDPLKEKIGLASTRIDNRGRTEVYLQLKPGETCILRTFKRNVKGPVWEYLEETDGVQTVKDWDVGFVEGGPTIPSDFSTVQPKPWTKEGGQEAEWFAGTAEYTATFLKPSGDREWILDLGEVYHSARVKVNGQAVATLITPPFKVNITDALQEGENTLEVEVTNLAANRIRYMEKRGIERPRFYNTGLSFGQYGGLGDASEWSVMQSGLEGPVQLIPAKSTYRLKR